jgi:membrane protease YdiL (CAAX protease family)
MAIFLLVVALYATGLLEMKSAILISFYSASIAVYTIVFTIVGTFLGFSKSRDENLKKKTKEGKKFNRNNALIGLIRMCIIFILITLIAFLTGMYTADTPVGPDVLSSKLGWTSLGILYPIIMLGLVAVSFPALFTYMYLIINYYLKNQESE